MEEESGRRITRSRSVLIRLLRSSGTLLTQANVARNRVELKTRNMLETDAEQIDVTIDESVARRLANDGEDCPWDEDDLRFLIESAIGEERSEDGLIEGHVVFFGKNYVSDMKRSVSLGDTKIAWAFAVLKSLRLRSPTDNLFLALFGTKSVINRLSDEERHAFSVFCERNAMNDYLSISNAVMLNLSPEARIRRIQSVVEEDDGDRINVYWAKSRKDRSLICFAGQRGSASYIGSQFSTRPDFVEESCIPYTEKAIERGLLEEALGLVKYDAARRLHHMTVLAPLFQAAVERWGAEGFDRALQAAREAEWTSLTPLTDPRTHDYQECLSADTLDVFRVMFERTKWTETLVAKSMFNAFNNCDYAYFMYLLALNKNNIPITVQGHLPKNAALLSAVLDHSDRFSDEFKYSAYFDSISRGDVESMLLLEKAFTFEELSSYFILMSWTHVGRVGSMEAFEHMRCQFRDERPFVASCVVHVVNDLKNEELFRHVISLFKAQESLLSSEKHLRVGRATVDLEKIRRHMWHRTLLNEDASVDIIHWMRDTWGASKFNNALKREHVVWQLPTFKDPRVSIWFWRRLGSKTAEEKYEAFRRLEAGDTTFLDSVLEEEASNERLVLFMAKLYIRRGNVSKMEYLLRRFPSLFASIGTELFIYARHVVSTTMCEFFWISFQEGLLTIDASRALAKKCTVRVDENERYLIESETFGLKFRRGEWQSEEVESLVQELLISCSK